MKNIFLIGRESSPSATWRRSLTGNIKVELAPEAMERIQRCRDYLDRKMETQKEPIYGITTGFGSLCDRTISGEDLNTLQEEPGEIACLQRGQRRWHR